MEKQRNEEMVNDGTCSAMTKELDGRSYRGECVGLEKP